MIVFTSVESSPLKKQTLYKELDAGAVPRSVRIISMVHRHQNHWTVSVEKQNKTQVMPQKMKNISLSFIFRMLAYLPEMLDNADWISVSKRLTIGQKTIVSSLLSSVSTIFVPLFFIFSRNVL